MHETALRALEEDTKQADLPLKDTATTLVFGKGNPDADIVIIGEAPGREEDAQGKPFVGAAGKQLDKLLQTIGLTTKDVYIANILKYRPPNNRDPTIEEVRAHTPYLLAQLRIIQPAVIVTLGNYATKYVLAGFNPERMKDIPGISHLHGAPHTIQQEGITADVLPLYHPAATLYNPSLREVLEADIIKVGERLVSLRTTVAATKIKDALANRGGTRQSTLF